METSPHAKIRKGGGEGGREGVREGAICSWKTLEVPVILAGKEVDKKKKNHKNETQLSDILRCYLLSRGTPSPSLFMIGCPCLKNELCWAQSSLQCALTQQRFYKCFPSLLLLQRGNYVVAEGDPTPRIWAAQSPDNLTVFSSHL